MDRGLIKLQLQMWIVSVVLGIAKMKQCALPIGMDTLAEWLRRWPATPMGSPCAGSNPAGVALLALACRAKKNFVQIDQKKKQGTHLGACSWGFPPSTLVWAPLFLPPFLTGLRN
jgi:hypothetical protein